MRVKRETRQASAGTKFGLLMWKNFMHQWRHKKQTVIELLLPVGTMALVLILRSEIEPVLQDTKVYPPIHAHALNYSLPVLAGMNFTQLSLAYSPENPMLDDVIRSSVVNLLLLNIRDIIPIILELFPDLPEIELPPINVNKTVIYEILKMFVNVRAYNSSADLRGIYSQEEVTRKVLAAVEFSDDLRDASELPINLSYALRFPERPRLSSFYVQGGRTWRTDAVFPLFELPGPRFPFSWEGGNDPGYVNEMFIALQQVISTELISRLTGEDLRNYIVSFQRYPHPPYVEDLVVEALQLLFPMFMILSFSYTAVNIVRAVTVEKELQLKESMKIMGLPTWLHWTAWFFKQFLYLMFTTVLIVVILKVNWFTNEKGFNDYAVFTNTSWSVLFFFIILYLSCMIFFCFMISGIFSKGSTAALFAGVVWFLSYVPALILSLDLDVSATVQGFTCLSINTAMSYGFQLLLSKESTGGMQWGEFFSSNTVDSTRFMFGHVVVMLVVDCILYMLIALYLEQVLPGYYGVPKPWYFLFQRDFWFPRRKDLSDDLIEDSNNDLVKEKDPDGHEIGVKITNLTKVYGNNIAVNNLNLNIYNDQITVLLGHNGAGKSTTISMMTGNVEITKGTVWLAGYDVRQELSTARAHLGLCPQHNVLFDELTVREHLDFYSRLKGYSGQQVHDEVDMLISNLEMEDKRDYLASGLSGGQKRRLCVGIALCGGASVVLLDEPTSGMDPASRRALWDLLQKMKKGRSMILTTHFMDEADILGDRVAIMSSGKLHCVGSPYFLKQHYGVGYTLVVVKKEDFSPERCTAVINKYIPNITIKEDRGTEVTYALTNNYSYLFQDMLNDLEINADGIQFANYGLVATTLEDVFMSVGSDVELNSEMDDSATATTISCGDDVLKYECGSASTECLDRRDENVRGWKLVWHHTVAIWQKLWLIYSRSWGVLTLQILVPLLIINATLGLLKYILSNVSSMQSRALTLTEGYLETETLLGSNVTSDTTIGGRIKAGYELYYGTANVEQMTLTEVTGKSIDEYYLARMNNSITRGFYRVRLLIGASISDESATAWFSNFGYHDVATSLATLHSAMLKGWNSAANINVFNHPLEAVYRDQGNLQLMVTLLSMQISTSLGNSLGIVSAAYIMFYIKERVSRAKLLQKASGVQPVVLWGAAAIFDWFWFLLISVTVIISCAAFQVIGLSTAAELGRLYLCMMLYGAAMLPLHYLFSHILSGPALGFVIMFFMNVLFGMMGAQIVEALAAPQLNTKEVAEIMDKVLQFFPLYSLVTAVRNLNQIGLTEYTCLESCDYLMAILPNMNECTMESLCELFSESCCVRENAYFDWERPGILRYLVCMIASGLFLWLLLMAIEYKIIQKLFNREKRPPPVEESSLDEDVADEARHVNMVTGTALAQHGLVAKNLSKYYGKHLAVNQVSFSVSDGECFGLLGINGAGKTTTFKMLMGDEAISSGEAIVSGYSVQKDITKVYENIGYCPQFDAVFEELTGRETLHLFSLFRGLPTDNSDMRAQALSHSLGFTKHLDKRVHQYSGGNKRKLSTAIALLGQTRLVFVDEPTTGVDPAAKRQVWRAVQAARRAGRGVVLTSHSMEECEALCSRLTIMVNGRFQCLGTPQHLKNKFSEGFTLTIKIKIDEDETPNDNIIMDIKNFINCNFTTPKLMEEYQGLLTYYLPDKTVAWSEMFGTMERAKRELYVEDYSISQTTLEQIFLQFTKYQRQSLQQAS